MTTYVEDITQALVNLGGQAKLDDIYNEVQRIRTVPLPKNWKANIRGIIENNCSDSTRFLGKEHFRKVDRGTYGLVGQGDIKRLIPAQNKDKPKQKPNIYTVSDSLEIISNTLRTIKEYREYSDPSSPTWMEYLKEFFHVLGFQTTEAGARLLLLRTLGEVGAAKAIVSIVLPGESFEVVGSEIQWETYLRYAANYHHVDWGILTDGIHLQVFDYGNHLDHSTLRWQDLNEIIIKEKTDKFFAIYKVFSYIKGTEQSPKNPSKTAVVKHKPNLKQISPKKASDSDDVKNFVHLLLTQRFGEGFIKVGRYNFMFESNSEIVYFQNSNVTGDEFWYRLSKEPRLLLVSSHKKAWLCLTNIPSQTSYIFPFSEVEEHVIRSGWNRDDIEISIYPKRSLWHQLKWDIGNYRYDPT